jgi:hypothetical protein
MRRLTACSLLCGLLLSACTDDPPDKERQQAEGAVQAALAAGADIYAPAELRDARSALTKYDEAVAQHDYRLALNNALEARDRSYEAVKQAGNKKAELRSRADRLVVDLDALLTVAANRLAAGGASGPAAERLRASRDAARTALQEARTQIAKQEYPAVVEKLTRVGEALRHDLQDRNLRR